MDSRKIIYFLSVLGKATKGHEDVLAGLFQCALDENDEIVRLKGLIGQEGSCVFYGERGRRLEQRGEEVLRKVYNQSYQSIELLEEVKQVSELIEHELNNSQRIMMSSYPVDETFIVCRRSDLPIYRLALSEMASFIVYTTASYHGTEPLKYLTWYDDVGIKEMYNAVYTKFLPTVKDIRRPTYGWVIKKRHLGGKALFGGDAFYLSYELVHYVQGMGDKMSRRSMSTNAFYDAYVYANDKKDVPICWGWGNLLSVMPNQALSLLQNNNIVTKLRCPTPQELEHEIPNPLECVRILSDGCSYCISPDELVLALNRWQVGHEIESRKKEQCCLFCNRPISRFSLVCGSHFTSEL